MKIINNIKELQETLTTRAAGSTIGFVPTMGALHDGHISLVKRCRHENDVIVVSIFVNPTQFNDKNDLKAYPRTEQEDIELLENGGCDIVFLPSIEEMYPTPDNRVFDFGGLSNVMEGINRPGHFNGVALIVSKLFDAVKPNKAYFGEKDYQQLSIIRKMTVDLNYDTQIIGCDICRNDSGLALSSRNMLLSESQLAIAPGIYNTLRKASDIKWINTKDAEDYVIKSLQVNPEFEVEYFIIADEDTLQPITETNKNSVKRGFIVVKVGSVRLIDNIRFNF